VADLNPAQKYDAEQIYMVMSEIMERHGRNMIMGNVPKTRSQGPIRVIAFTGFYLRLHESEIIGDGDTLLQALNEVLKELDV